MKINNENNEKHYLFMKYTIFQPKKATFLCIIAEKAVSLQANNNSYETQHSFSNTDYIRMLGLGGGESAVPRVVCQRLGTLYRQNGTNNHAPLRMR